MARISDNAPAGNRQNVFRWSTIPQKLFIIIHHHVFVNVPRYNEDAYPNSFFPYTARLLNSLPAECVPLAYVIINGLKSKINRHMLLLGMLFILAFLFF